MTLKSGPKGIAAALVASFVMATTPAHALDLPRRAGRAPIAVDAGVSDAAHYRHYRRRNNGIDAGDIIAGILVLGGIAAVASAASRDDDQPRRYPADARDAERDRDRQRERGQSFESRGITRAVDMCVNEIERGRDRVAGVDEGLRNAEGWLVSGVLESGQGFTCRIGNDGRIDEINVGTRYDASSSTGEDRQYGEAVYTRLRAAQAGTPEDRRSVRMDGDTVGGDPQPAYPGGPFPGEEGYDDYVGAGSPDEARY